MQVHPCSSKINTAIESAISQPRRSERRADANAVLDAIHRANDFLRLPVKDRAGISITYRVGGGSYPACCNYKAMDDLLYFEHDGKAWRLVSACREDVKDRHVCDMFLMSNEQKVKDFDARAKLGL